MICPRYGTFFRKRYIFGIYKKATYLFGPSDGVGAGEGHDTLVAEAHAVEHVADVVLRAEIRQRQKKWLDYSTREKVVPSCPSLHLCGELYRESHRSIVSVAFVGEGGVIVRCTRYA